MSQKGPLDGPFRQKRSTHETVLAMLEARCDPNPLHRGVAWVNFNPKVDGKIGSVLDFYMENPGKTHS